MINKRIAYFFWVISFLMIPSLLIAQQLSDSVSNDIDPIYNTTDSSFNKQDSSLLVLDSTQIKQESKVIAYLLRKDSLDVYTYSFFRDSVNYIHYQYIDTLNHLSDQYNPTKYLDVFYNDLGNVGSAQENQVFSPSTKTGLNIGMNNFNAFLWLPKDIEVYDIQTPYTDLFYLMGPKKENSLKITHAQSFLKEQLSVNLKFQLYNSIGFYNHQRNDVKSFYGGMGYRTKNSRYKINAQYYHNKQVLDENGGIVNLSDFENNAESNRQIIDTKLSTGQNLIRVSGLALEQSFYISKPEPDFSQISDTNTIKYNGYSVTHFKKPYFDPVSHLGQIRYYFNFERNNLKYTDQEQESSIYDGIPFYPTYDSAIFFDTIGTRKYQNELIYSNSDYIDDVNHPKFINYFFGGRQEYNEYYQDSTKKYFNNYALIGGVFLNISPYLSVLSDAAFYYGDYLNGDLLFNGKVFLNIKKNYLTGGVQISHRSADWMFQEFSSSRFTWHNSFDKTDEQKLYVKIERKNILLFAQVRNISNYIF
ncbi:MAG: hypothetical protein GQ527_08795, partial [Bacteroidales bacterium]|nr:hypothetical protein [Bacteroidales bacterium]